MDPNDDILVVEDDQRSLELVQFLLEEAGYHVRVARDGNGLRCALAQAAPDLVLMDMQLPGADGAVLVRELRRDPSTARIPVVALTAHAMRGDRERFLAAGCDGYLSKPIDAGRFVQQVRAFLARPDAHGAGGRTP